MPRCIPHLIFMSCLLLPGIALAEDEEPSQVEDTALGFEFDIPEGYTEFESNDDDTLYTFLEHEPSAVDPPLVIRIQRLRGRIDPNQRLSESELPEVEGQTFSLEEIVWSSRPMDVIVSLQDLPREDFVTYTLQVPLQAEAMQLVVGGVESRREEVAELFRTAVAGFRNTTPLYTGRPTTTPSAPSGETEPISFPWKGVAIIGFMVLVLVAIIGKWVRGAMKK